MQGFQTCPEIQYTGYIIKCSVYSVCLFSPVVIAYLIAHYAHIMPESQTSMLLEKCKEKAHDPPVIWENRSLMDSGVYFVLPGAYFGVLIDSRFLNGSSKLVNSTPIWKSLLRLGVLAGIGGILISPVFLLSLHISIVGLFF